MTSPEQPPRGPAERAADRTAGPLGSDLGGPPPAGPGSGSAGRVSPPARTEPSARGRSRGRGIGLTLAAALLVFVTVVLVLFVLFNTQTVQVSLVFGDVQAPLVIALLIAAGLGALLVTFLSAVLAGRRRRNR
jgi:uncharacterized integral membrane protein